MFKKKNKKGFIGWLIMAIVVIASIGIIAVVSNKIHNEWNTEVQTNSAFPEVAKNESAILNTSMPGVLDFFTLIIMLAFTIGAMLTAYFAETSPILLGVTVLLLLSILIIPMLLSNMWEDFITESDFIDLRSEYPITDFIMSYYAHVFVGVIILASLAGFVRLRS